MRHHLSHLTHAERVAVAVTAPRRDRDLTRELMLACDDWEAVFRIGERHQFLAQLAVAAENLGIANDLPPDVSARLREVLLEAVLLDRLFAHSLRGLVERFDEREVPFLLLKGRGLAERFYEDARERPCRDIDILVREESYARAREALCSLNFAPYREDDYRKHHFHVPFIRKGIRVPVIVEVHWDVVFPRSPLQLEVDDWWDRSRNVKLEAGEVLLPAAQDDLLLLAHHVFQAFAVTLGGLADVGRVASELDSPAWDSIERRAKRSGVGPFLRQALLLVHEFWGLPVQHLPEPEPSARGRRWLGDNLMAPDVVLSSGRARWWAYRKVGYWSMLPSDAIGAADLFSDLDRTMFGVPYSNRSRREFPFRRHLAVCMALAFCCLPHRIFPATLKSD
jgi:hypothetical protein